VRPFLGKYLVIDRFYLATWKWYLQLPSRKFFSVVVKVRDGEEEGSLE
jgi:hypothetical protein